MKNPIRVLANILDCTISEVEMLLETDIDITSSVQYIIENHDTLNTANIYHVSFFELVNTMLGHLKEFDEDDFRLSYNGTQDTHIYINGDTVDYYRKTASIELDEIEDIMNMEFEET